MDTLLKLPSSAEIKNEWSQTSAVPVCFRGVDRVNFTFFPFAGGFLTDRIVSNQWTTRVILGHFWIEFTGNSSCLVTSLAFSLLVHNSALTPALSCVFSKLSLVLYVFSKVHHSPVDH